VKRRREELPPELPIHLGVRSNGEYLWEPGRGERDVARLAHAMADERARHLGVDRRSFLASAAGMMCTLAAADIVHGCKGEEGAAYPTDKASCDPDGATEALAGNEFVFDVQTHHVDAKGSWRDTNFAYETFYGDLLPLLRDDCTEGVECFSFEQYTELVFAESDTTVAVLSGVPALDCDAAAEGEPCGNPLDNAAMARARDRVNQLAASERIVTHAMVTPNTGLDAELAKMKAARAEMGVRAWKLYTPWGPLPPEELAALEGKTESELVTLALKGEIKGTGFWLDDPDIGLPVIEHGIALGVPVFCVHKGLPLPTFDPAFTSSRDVGRLAARYPEARFIVYHSSFNTGAQTFTERLTEGPYEGPDADPAMADKGVNDLLNALRDNDIPQNGNVWAELGGVWGALIAYPEQAQHVIGKLLKYVGERRVLWGTDAIWGGTPQPLIEAFRAFEISPAFQDKYGYPALTPEIKARILGLNAAEIYGIDPEERRCKLAGDALALRRAEHRLARRLEPRPFPRGLGPRSRCELVRLWWSHRNEPG
jgi:predicted TIM-barrel fold metal-dependent hydrolase